MTARPKVRLQPKHDARLRSGVPWAYSNEIAAMSAAVKALKPGTLVDLVDTKDANLGTAYFNPHSLIAARVLSRDAGAKIDAGYFRDRFDRARALRDRLVATPHYRLIHAEADGCPGLVIDRFDDIFVVQSGTAGMDQLEAHWIDALKVEFKPRAIVVKSDSPSRAHEGLKDDVRIAHGDLAAGVHVEEAGIRHTVDPINGQKTGWFFDQRDNRTFLTSLAKGATVLDAFSYLGAFGLGAAKAGAKSVVLMDSSQSALDASAATARAEKLDAEFRRCDVMEELEEIRPAGERFDIVSCDPPPFARSKKDLESGARGYRKLARLAAPLVAPGGFLCLASCSHAIDMARFQTECAVGISRADRTARLIRVAGAAADHPVHPMLPETAYLKSLTYQLD
ncbi:MAG: class I SAM-dependent rRNA methyltransferase [Alphaproteobacteria bacterium]|nr:class I SAM-dependent rRNA methyltransferase [Alphaproteobacteria bacterium]